MVVKITDPGARQPGLEYQLRHLQWLYDFGQVPTFPVSQLHL